MRRAVIPNRFGGEESAVSRQVVILRRLQPSKDQCISMCVDIADVDGNGRVEFILEGNEYENHWFEVISAEDDSFKTIFSGLGYYL